MNCKYIHHTEVLFRYCNAFQFAKPRLGISRSTLSCACAILQHIVSETQRFIMVKFIIGCKWQCQPAGVCQGQTILKTWLQAVVTTYNPI